MFKKETITLHQRMLVRLTQNPFENKCSFQVLRVSADFKNLTLITKRKGLKCCGSRVLLQPRELLSKIFNSCVDSVGSVRKSLSYFLVCECTVHGLPYRLICKCRLYFPYYNSSKHCTWLTQNQQMHTQSPAIPAAFPLSSVQY